MTAILALSAAVVYGTADFFGGVAARRTSPMAVTLFAHVVGLALLVVAIPLLPAAHPGRSTCSTAALAGALGAGGLILFYRALSRGTMSVVAPVAALFGAALPGDGRPRPGRAALDRRHSSASASPSPPSGW